MSLAQVRGTVLPVAGALLRKPRLWVAAVLTLGRLARPGWWRSHPYLPLPDDRLWAFRMETVYGRPDAAPDVEDVLVYLDWSRHDARRRSWRRRGLARHVDPAHEHLASDGPD